MWTWFDGHLLLVMAGCPIVAFLVVGLWNGRKVRRWEQGR